MKVLGNIWIYLYPIIIVSSMIIILLNLIGFKLKFNFLNVFSRIFMSLILLSFLYYSYITLSRNSKSFIDLISGYYEWVIYLAFYFLIIGVIGSAIVPYFKAKK